MAELVKYIACCLVDHPDLVEVREVPGDQALILELRVAPEDMGKVIGKQGRIAKAIRAVVKAASLRPVRTCLWKSSDGDPRKNAACGAQAAAADGRGRGAVSAPSRIPEESRGRKGGSVRRGE